MATRRRICWIRVLAKMVILESWPDSIHSPTFANLFLPDSIHSPTFANLFWSDSIHSPTFANLVCSVSPESQVLQVSFYTYKICYLCLKQPILSWANICRGLASTRQTRRHSPTCFGRTRFIRRHSPTCYGRTWYIRRHSPTYFAWTRQTRPHLPKGFFEKNATRLDTFVRVIRHSGEFGASGHCLIKTQTIFGEVIKIIFKATLFMLMVFIL